MNTRPNVDAVIFHVLLQRSAESWSWVKPKDANGQYWGKPVFCTFANRLGDPYDCSGPIPLW